jgi:GNAT superfamily N-acetyltransferase
MTTTVSAKGIRVRRASRADIPQLPELCAQLGYESTEAEIRTRFDDIASCFDEEIFVAEIADGRIAGFLGVFVMRTIASNPRAEISGLVVNESHRSRGVGKLLMQTAEAWAREHGCGAVTLRSNVIRDTAHRFYENLGYKHVKTQKSFRKVLER